MILRRCRWTALKAVACLLTGVGAFLNVSGTPTAAVRDQVVAQSFRVPDLPQAIVIAPRGKFFTYVKIVPDLGIDRQRYQLRVFRAAAVNSALAGKTTELPKPSAEMEIVSGSQVGVLSRIEWNAEGDELLVIADRELNSHADGGCSGIYLLNAESGKITTVADPSIGILDVANVASSNGEIIFQGKTVANRSPNNRYPAAFLDPLEFEAGIGGFGPLSTTWAHRSVWNTFTYSAGNGLRKIGNGWEINPLRPKTKLLRLGKFFLSPSGKQVVLAWPSELLPSQGTIFPARSRDVVVTESAGFQWLWVDLESGRFRALSPVTPYRKRMSLEALWSSDGSRVILASLAPIAAAGSHEVGQAYEVAEVDMATNRAAAICRVPFDANAEQLDAPLLKVNRVDEHSILVIEGTTRQPDQKRRIFEKVADNWTMAASDRMVGRGAPPSVSPSLEDDLKILIQESPIDPPQVTAINHGRSLTLDTASASPKAPVVEPRQFEWRDNAGRRWTAGLLLPPGIAGPLSLVVQIQHRYDPQAFALTGTFASYPPYAAHALVNRGMAVMMLGVLDSGLVLGGSEGPVLREAIASAVKALGNEHCIDVSRVGLIGHSRTAYHVDYLITNPGAVDYAAAVSYEGTSMSYGYLLAYTFKDIADDDFGLTRLNMDARYGGRFWENKGGWLDSAPGFNLERVRTPLLLAGGRNGEDGIPGVELDLELYSGLKQLRKPVDYLFFQNGSHNLSRPLQRLALQTAVVDWMAFWLMNETPDDEARASRWAALRQQQVKVLSTPPPPTGRLKGTG